MVEIGVITSIIIILWIIGCFYYFNKNAETVPPVTEDVNKDYAVEIIFKKDNSITYIELFEYIIKCEKRRNEVTIENGIDKNITVNNKQPHLTKEKLISIAETDFKQFVQINKLNK